MYLQPYRIYLMNSWKVSLNTIKYTLWEELGCSRRDASKSAELLSVLSSRTANLAFVSVQKLASKFHPSALTVQVEKFGMKGLDEREEQGRSAERRRLQLFIDQTGVIHQGLLIFTSLPAFTPVPQWEKLSSGFWQPAYSSTAALQQMKGRHWQWLVLGLQGYFTWQQEECMVLPVKIRMHLLNNIMQGSNAN